MDLREHYNTLYANEHAPSQYHQWIYYPYITSLFSRAGVKPGSSVLDVGCGQGFFSYAIHKCGFRVHGVDISEEGIKSAQRAYGDCGITFEVADLLVSPVLRNYDCVFVRSCSLYNTEKFPSDWDITRALSRHLKEGGVFMFLYNSKCSNRKEGSWRYHDFGDVEKHFNNQLGARVFFSSRFDTLIAGKYAFNPLFTKFNMLMSRLLGVGGDLICIFTKEE